MHNIGSSGVEDCVSQLSSLRAAGEGRDEGEMVRQAELEQLRRQLHQLQTSAEVHTHTPHIDTHMCKHAHMC